MNIIEIIENRTKTCADKTAIFFRDQKITFRQLQDTSYKLADALKDLSLKPKDKVAVYLPNCPHYLFSYLAVWVSGATIVPLDFMLTTDELISCISHCEAKIAIIKSKANIDLDQIKKSCPFLKEIILFQDKKEGYLLLEDLILQAEPNKPNVKINDKDYATIFYTSGTTGKPKGVLINYRQLEASPRAMEYFAGLNESDLALCALPFSHLGGLVFLQAIIYLGSSIVIMERFIPIEFLKNIQSYKITCFWLVPPMYYAILHLKEFETFDLSSLKWVVSFGAPGSPEQLRRFHQFCPKAALLHGWGMTETNAPNVVLPKDSEKLESVGKVAPWIEVKIFSSEVGNEQDKELPKGQIGEIVIKGWVVTDGYYKDDALTKETLRNGWFHTGDLGKFDNEDFLYIMGRKKEMIKVAGEIVFEPEVETALYKHPDILEVAVIGVADKLRGEVPKAIIAFKEGKSVSEQELRSFCREHLAHFKIPHYFEFLKQLPKNRVGKIDKAILRKQPL